MLATLVSSAKVSKKVEVFIVVLLEVLFACL
jgi:hypothetical protein